MTNDNEDEEAVRKYAASATPLARKLVGWAEANRRIPTLALLNTHDVVFGVWQDRNHPTGINSMILKGESVARKLAGKIGDASKYRFTAITCSSAENAEALRDAIGRNEEITS